MRIEIPTSNGTSAIEVEPSRPAILLGPNGSGKTRLGIYIDDLESSGATHRIAAQRSLELPDEVFSEKYEQAIGSVRRDKADKRRKKASPGSMEYAYDQLLTALFAEHSRALEGAHAASTGKTRSKRPRTSIDRLQELWRELIPHQSLVFSERAVRAVPVQRKLEPFDGSEMSDGERLIVYMLGQAILLETGGLLIVDEPELHMSRSLVVRVWDAIEKARPDCSFIYITHDVDFAASRRGARMYAVLEFRPPTYTEVLKRGKNHSVEDRPPQWTFQAISSGPDMPNDILVRIVGSRKPILFVEGQTGGLDHIIYNSVYEEFTVIPVGSCNQVVQLVRSFRAQRSLHWIHCAGLVDKDFRKVGPRGRLKDGLHALPVNEVENLLLVPGVFVALATAMSFPAEDVKTLLASLKTEVLKWASREAERMSLKRTSDRIWKASSSIGIKADNITDLVARYKYMIAKTDPAVIYKECRAEYDRLLKESDYDTILKDYDSNGGLLLLLAKCLNLRDRAELEASLAHHLMKNDGPPLINALSIVLPAIHCGA